MKTNAARILEALGIRYEIFDVISVSAGIRGTQILPAPPDYLRATKAKVGPLTR
jgi:prolyl-tRNA editing enzyme YbaK/EbsC (Cys-tRNA(Pro) deacylase)